MVSTWFYKIYIFPFWKLRGEKFRCPDRLFTFSNIAVRKTGQLCIAPQHQRIKKRYQQTQDKVNEAFYEVVSYWPGLEAPCLLANYVCALIRPFLCGWGFIGVDLLALYLSIICLLLVFIFPDTKDSVYPSWITVLFKVSSYLLPLKHCDKILLESILS